MLLTVPPLSSRQTTPFTQPTHTPRQNLGYTGIAQYGTSREIVFAHNCEFLSVESEFSSSLSLSLWVHLALAVDEFPLNLNNIYGRYLMGGAVGYARLIGVGQSA